MIAEAAAVKRRSRYAHSNNFYREISTVVDIFSTAGVHKTKLRRKNLFIGEYFHVERPIATRGTKDERSFIEHNQQKTRQHYQKCVFIKNVRAYSNHS